MANPPKRNPYIVGGWVTGKNFYGHTLLRHNIHYGPNNYLWIVGTRRIGKTSLLRQLALDAGDDYLTIYWDMQGCQTATDLSDELFYAVEENATFFRDLGLDVDHLDGADIRHQIRTLCHVGSEHKRSVLLLIDEPEVLISIARQEPAEIQRLRAAFQRPHNLRVVMASTKSLARMEEVSQDWLTSTFLTGFAPRHLSSLSPEESEALIRQVHAEERVQVSDEAVAAIQDATNNHPYLVQWLCYRLYQSDGSLRMPGEADISLDPMLNSLFSLTYKHLSPTERGVMHHLLENGATNEQVLARALQIEAATARTYLYALNRLGYTRRDPASGETTLGNRFFRLWLEANSDHLNLDDAEISDDSVQELATVGQKEEVAYWEQQLRVYRANLARLEVQAANHGLNIPLHLQNELDFHRRRITELEVRLDALRA